MLFQGVTPELASYPGPSHFLSGWEGPGYEVTPECRNWVYSRRGSDTVEFKWRVCAYTSIKYLLEK